RRVSRAGDGVEPFRIGCGDLETCASEERAGRRQARLELPPRGAAVGRLEDAAAVAGEHRVFPGSLARLPERGVDGLRIGWIQDDVDAAGVGVAVEDFLERAAAIERAEDPALLVRTVRMAEDGDEEAVRIG